MNSVVLPAGSIPLAPGLGRRERERSAGAPVGLHCRAGVVGGKLKDRQLGQLSFQ